MLTPDAPCRDSHVEGRETSEAEAAAQSRPAFAPIAFPQM